LAPASTTSGQQSPDREEASNLHSCPVTNQYFRDADKYIEDSARRERSADERAQLIAKTHAEGWKLLARAVNDGFELIARAIENRR
jgi:hypothetical protein